MGKQLTVETEMEDCSILILDTENLDDKKNPNITREIRLGSNLINFRIIFDFRKGREKGPLIWYQLVYNYKDELYEYTYNGGHISYNDSLFKEKYKLQARMDFIKGLIYRLMRKYNIEDNGILSDFPYETKLQIEKEYGLHDAEEPLYGIFDIDNIIKGE